MSAIFNSVSATGDDAFDRNKSRVSAFLGLDGYEPLEGQLANQILPGISLADISGYKSSSLARLDRSQSNDDRVTDTSLFIDILGMCSAVDPVELYFGEFVYAPLATGVCGIGNAGGSGTVASGGLFIGRKMSEYAAGTVGAEISSFNVASNPFTFDSNAPRATHDWGNGVETHRDRLNFLATQAGIPLNQFWIPFDPVKYPQRADSVVDGTGAASDPRGVPNLGQINVTDWYRFDLPLPSDFQHGLVVSGQGRFINHNAIEILRTVRNSDWPNGQWRNGIVFRNDTGFGDSVLDSLISATGNPANTAIGGKTPVLRGIDLRNVATAYETISIDNFRIDGTGSQYLTGNQYMMPTSGIWFQQPPLEATHGYPVPTGNEFPAMRVKPNKIIFSFNTNSHYVIDATNGTAAFRNGAFSSL